jgi:FKBP-type peptidyl-prolyl cis-trans isomerase SlyD
MDKIKKGDFIELDFTAKLTSNDMVYDTTSEQVAKDNNIYSKEYNYNPLIVTVGEGHLLKGLDEFVEGKELGEYHVKIPAEKAFGKKDAKLLRLISLGEFKKHNIQAMPGLEVELDGQRGIIRTVNGGRVIVDFNHPLSSQEVNYDVVIKNIITDDKRRIEALLNLFKIPIKSVEVSEGKVIIEFGVEMPQEITKPIADEIVRLVGIRDIVFK